MFLQVCAIWPCSKSSLPPSVCSMLVTTKTRTLLQACPWHGHTLSLLCYDCCASLCVRIFLCIFESIEYESLRVCASLRVCVHLSCVQLHLCRSERHRVNIAICVSMVLLCTCVCLRMCVFMCASVCLCVASGECACIFVSMCFITCQYVPIFGSRFVVTEIHAAHVVEKKISIVVWRRREISGILTIDRNMNDLQVV